jgi:hypothetical protein
MVLGSFRSNYPDIKEKTLYFMAWHDAFIEPKAQSLATGWGCSVSYGPDVGWDFLCRCDGIHIYCILCLRLHFWRMPVLASRP